MAVFVIVAAGVLSWVGYSGLKSIFFDIREYAMAYHGLVRLSFSSPAVSESSSWRMSLAMTLTVERVEKSVSSLMRSA